MRADIEQAERELNKRINKYDKRPTKARERRLIAARDHFDRLVLARHTEEGDEAASYIMG